MIKQGDEEAETGEECRICRIAMRRMVMHIELVVITNHRWIVC